MLRSWLGIPPGSGIRQLRFGEFCRLEHGCIAEVRCLYDAPGLAAQAGIELLPDFGGRELNERAWNGWSPAETSKAGSSNTEPVAEMIGACNRLEGSDLNSQGMEDHWHPDMEWHGHWGIGSARGLEQFHRIARVHPCGRFRAGGVSGRRRRFWPRAGQLPSPVGHHLSANSRGSHSGEFRRRTVRSNRRSSISASAGATGSR